MLVLYNNITFALQTQLGGTLQNTFITDTLYRNPSVLDRIT